MQRTFLVADGACVVTRRVRNQLERAGVPGEAIVQAFDGTEVRKRFLEHRPDVCLLALEFPDEEGHEIAEDIWEEDPGAHVVLMAASDRRDPRVRRTLEKGARAVLEKPIHESDVRKLMTQLGQEELGRARIP